jgi:uncharacterized protein
MKTYAIRLLPGEDVKQVLKAFTLEKKILAGAILTAVGSLTHASLRYAAMPTATRIETAMEVLALVGTLSPDGPHLHLTVSDSEGKTLGGHVMDGCIVRTTLEIVLIDLPEMRFSREKDPKTGYEELVIKS